MGTWNDAVESLKDDLKAGRDKQYNKNHPPNGVVITGVKISFFNLVDLFVKAALAMVPAAIIVFLIWIFLARFLFGAAVNM